MTQPRVWAASRCVRAAPESALVKQNLESDKARGSESRGVSVAYCGLPRRRWHDSTHWQLARSGPRRGAPPQKKKVLPLATLGPA